MAEDIVTRLREGLFQEGTGCGEYGCYTSESDLTNRDLIEAADEIERLRAEVTRWKELAADLAMQCAINEMEGGDA